MLSVNVVCKGGWILERLARELADHIPGVTLNASGWPPQSATSHALTYCLPAKDIRHFPSPPTGILVGYFTHGKDRARVYAERFDACLAMNTGMAAYLRTLGARGVQVIRPGTDPVEHQVRFGVCGRVYGKGRKGAYLVRAAVLAGYDFRACTDPNTREAAPCRITHSIAERSAFYGSIDYLVVTSTDEGGPMPVLEAIAHGVPVIAPNVGWCWEFPVIRYEHGS